VKKEEIAEHIPVVLKIENLSYSGETDTVEKRSFLDGAK